MRKLRQRLLILFISGCCLQACKKNMVDENYTPITNPVTPDFTTQINASVNGFITDENGAAVKDAVVKAGSVTTTTDEFGYFKISNAAFAKSAGFIQITKSGYFAGYRTFLPVEGKLNFIRLQLIQKITIGTFESAAGGTINTSDGASVSLPANAVVIEATNAAYTGLVNVAAHWIDPSQQNTTQLTMPGNLTGVDSAGHLNVLQTFGMMAVELSGSNGERLQIAQGKKASLHFPIPSLLTVAAPALIPLWYFDESKGVWKEEGSAVKNGGSYDGEVSHFTFWNCDVNFPLVNLSFQVVDVNLNPVANATVLADFQSWETGSMIAYTDTDGRIKQMIPAGTDIQLKVLAPCNYKVEIKNLHTNNSDVDLGSIKVDLQQYGSIFKGHANKCDGSPVTNGFVVITGEGVSNTIEISNGVYNAALTICPNSTVTITAIDKEAMQKSSPLNLIPVTGQNDIGELSVCIPITGEYFLYELDGVGTLLTVSEHQFTVGYFLTQNITQLEARNLISSYRSIGIDIAGYPVAGIHSTTNGLMDFCPLNSVNGNNTPFAFGSPTTINITEYGSVGQFIKGNYNGTVRGVYDNMIHTLNFTFQLQRDQ